mgnify:CR=1 FL=1
MRNQPLTTVKLCDFIINYIENKTPSSFIRLGDGEAIMLGYNDISSPSEITMMTKKIFGNYPFTKEQLLHLKELLIASCQGANIIGVPPAKNRTLSKYYRRIEDIFIPKYKLFDSNIQLALASFHRNLQEEDLYEKILKNKTKIYCISGRQVKGAIENRFNIECELIKVPPQSSDSHNSYNNHPDLYKNIVEQIRVNRQGDLWFVGAGFYGKAYCNEIKKRGGIAIDVGSVFDAWLGIRSRGYISEDYKIV